MMGSGGLIVLDEDDCMVELVQILLQDLRWRSPAERSVRPAVSALKRMLEIPHKDYKGTGHNGEDIDKLEELCYYVKTNSLCALGQTAPNRCSTCISSATNTKHISKKKRCPAGVCKTPPLLRHRP